MLKVSCNATDRIHALSQCRFLGAPKQALACRRKGGAFLRLPAAGGPVTAVVSDRSGGVDGSATRVDAGFGSLADRLRLGSLTEDGLSYKEKFIVRCYEVGMNKTATVETIANLLQVQIRFSLFSISVSSLEASVCLHFFSVLLFWISVAKPQFLFLFGGICGFWVSGLVIFHSLVPALAKKILIYFLKILVSNFMRLLLSTSLVLLHFTNKWVCCKVSCGVGTFWFSSKRVGCELCLFSHAPSHCFIV